MDAPYRLNLAMPGDRRREALHPWLVRMRVHPVDPDTQRGMVHDDHRRRVAVLGEPGAEPGGAYLAKAAAVAPYLERIEDDHAQPIEAQAILREARGHRHLREDAREIGAVIMV